MGNILRKRRPKANDIAVDNTPVELEKFKQWEKILPELKKHAITYFDGETQFNYAQCSNLCKMEIQKLEKVPSNTPKSFELRSLNEECTDMLIHACLRNSQTQHWYAYDMKFINMENNKHKWIVQINPQYRRASSTRVFQNDENTIYDGTAIEGALRHVEHRANISKRHGELLPFVLKVSSWPNQLSSGLRRLHEACSNFGPFFVHVNEQTYGSFMEFMESSPISTNIFIECEPPENPFVLPPAFFDSKLFQQTVEDFSCSGWITITNEQFLGTKAKKLFFESRTITSEAVLQKLLNWFNDVASVADTNFTIVKFERDGQHWDRQTIIGSLPFRQQNADYYKIQKNGGLTGELKFRYFTLTALCFEAFKTK